MPKMYKPSINVLPLIPDTRNTNLPPQQYKDIFFGQTEILEFKLSSVLGISGTHTYGVLRTTMGWFEPSGGPIQQEFRTSNTTRTEPFVYIRCSINDGSAQGAFGTWGSWKKIA